MQHLKDARLMGWHPLIIKWCLYLRHLSGKAYETTRSSGCIKLLSQRTLRELSINAEKKKRRACGPVVDPGLARVFLPSVHTGKAFFSADNSASSSSGYRLPCLFFFFFFPTVL